MYKLSIIVPYRNRKGHFKKFVPMVNKFLSMTNIQYDIVFVEQADEKPFNRAKLLNVGFDLCTNSDYFCFHDIDMLPISPDCDYSIVAGVCKMSYYISQFNFIPRPENELGGVTLIDKKSFLEVNGYSNNYWGWGVEDNDFALRCATKNIPLSIRKGRYMSLSHKPNGDTYGGPPSLETVKNREYFHKIQSNPKELFLDGISTLKYKIKNTIKEKNFLLYQVYL